MYCIYLIFLYYIFDIPVLYIWYTYTIHSFIVVWWSSLTSNTRKTIMLFLSMLFLWHTDRHGQSFYYTCAAKLHLSVSRLSAWRRAKFPQRRCQTLDICLDHLFRRSKVDNRSFFRLYLTYNDLIHIWEYTDHYVTIFISFLIFITLILHAIKQKALKLTLLKVKI